jgi:hypothetical protein
MPNIIDNFLYVGNIELIYKSYNLFEGMLWPIRFHSKFISRISNYNYDQIVYILCYIFVVGMGKFHGRKKKSSKDE